MKTLWVDILCLESAVKIINLFPRTDIAQIYFSNRAKLFPKWGVSLLAKITGKPFSQADTIVEADEHIGDTSLFELTYLKDAKFLEHWTAYPAVAESVAQIAQKEGYNPRKLNEHIWEAASPHFFKVAEMTLFAKKICGEDDALYLCKSGATRSFLERELGSGKVFFYSTWLGLWGGIEGRPLYLWDRAYNKIYVLGQVELIIRLWGYWLGVLLNI